MKEIPLVQGSPEWLAWRRNRLTASDVAAILEISHYKSRLDIWKEKIGVVKQHFTNKAMQDGQTMEPIARAAYEDLKGEMFQPVVAEHDKIYYLGASFDGISLDRKRAVEIKCGEKTFYYAEQGSIFEDYICQVQTQLLVSDIESIDMFFYQPNKNPITIPVYRDERMIKRIIEESEIFWDCVLNFKVPQQVERQLIYAT